ncbi:hypothetical protein GmHk_16G046065 [Glycine max]|nr:hypothetical protein GmHk_16G046065 [Glycine max]
MDLNDLFIQHGKQITNYNLPTLSLENIENNSIPRVIQEELLLNNDQLIGFNVIMDVIRCKQSQVFFLWMVQEEQIPINVETNSFCSISKQSNLAKLIRETITIIWNEAPVTNRYALEALDCLLKDILDCDAPFGGKVMVLGEDFHQVLLVVQKGTKTQMISACIVEGDTHNLYQHEYLHSIPLGGLPPNILKVKKSASLMLLQNINPKSNLCNRARLLCHGFFYAHTTGRRTFLPRTKHKTTEGVRLPYFLVKLSFAITINKSQGQTIPNVGIYLPQHVFSHGQLNVALSRGVSQVSTKILIREGKLEGEDGNFTKNVVFKEILLSQT